MKRIVLFSCFLLLWAGLLAARPVQAADGVSVDARHFPDPVFRQWLLDEANLDGAGADGLFTPEELAQITELRVSGLGISSLEGIEFFPALTTLACRNNQLAELDVSRNPDLTTLLCDLNRLTRLDLSQNTKLVNLNCERNQLSQLDLTGCTELKWLYCRHNLLEQLDLSANTKLVFIETFDNRLTSIDLSGLTALEFLHIDHNKLTHLDLSHNTALVNSGSGFVARNNYIQTIVLPDHENLTVEMDVYAEQNPMEGYAKTEWYLDQGYTQPIRGDLQAKGQTLYAKWIPNPYTIYFDLNGGTGAAPPISTEYGSPAVLPAHGVSRKGHIFQGWLGYVDGRQRLFAPGETVYSLTGRWDYQSKITLQAKWEPYQLKLDANGGKFSDGGETAVFYTEEEAAILPGSQQVGRADMELLAWAAAARPEWTQETPFYLPGAQPALERGADLYAQWHSGEPAIVYHGPDGTVRLQSLTLPSLPLYDADTFSLNGRPLLAWNTMADGSGTRCTPGEPLDGLEAEDGFLHLYPFWGRPTSTELALERNSYPYTGRPVEPRLKAEVSCGGAPVDGAAVEFLYFSASAPEIPLPGAPVNTGSYLVQAVFPGDPALDQLESRSFPAAFSIVRGEPSLDFGGPQILPWTGAALTVRPSLTLNGLPWQAELRFFFRREEDAPWTPGLPEEPGFYLLRAELEETADYAAAWAETTLSLYRLQLANGVITGSIPVALPAGPDICLAMAALYDQDSGQMLDVNLRTLPRASRGAILEQIRLDPGDRTNWEVRLYLLDKNLTALSPAPIRYEVLLPSAMP